MVRPHSLYRPFNYLAALVLAIMVGCSSDKPVAPVGDNSSPTDATGPSLARSSGASNAGDIIPGKYIVVLKTDGNNQGGQLSSQAIQNVADDNNVQVDNLYSSVLSGFSASLSEAEYQKLLSDQSVSYIEPDRTIQAIAQTVPYGITNVKAPAAHARGVKGNAVKVGIIDTGIDYLHPDLAGNYAGGYDFVNLDADPMDDAGHGTHVSGTVAGIDNTLGVIGVAPVARLYGVKVLDASGSGTFANVIAGIDWCATNAMQVINMSLGASSGSSALETACNNAYAAGIVICGSAGNGYGAPVGFPARYASVIAVSAVDINNSLASFSNVGPEVEVTAPGVAVYSTLPNNSYASWDGTSMSCPHVTGVAALVWSTGLYTTPAEVRARITSTAFDLGPAGRDTQFGYGIVDADAATLGGTPPPNVAPVAVNNGPYSGSVNVAVSFSSAGSYDPDGTVVGYLWDFGDGITSTTANPSHTYTAPATYNVSLTVTDNLGLTGSSSTTASIAGTPPPNVAPVAVSNGPYSGSINVAVAFSSAGSFDPDGTVVGYLWDFGDGTTSTAANPSHTYTAAATFNVTLTVTDNLGLTGSSSTTATIAGTPPPNIAPVAVSNGPYSGTVSVAVSFSSAGSYDPDGTVVGYLWDFGDGTTSTAANPSHAYTAAATYNVTLTVTDNLGLTGSSSTTAAIVVGGGDDEQGEH